MIRKRQSMKQLMAQKITIWLISLCVIVTIQDLKAQDPQFTQFYANPLYLNPAFAGTARCPRICMNYRNQWPSLSGTYVTYSASYDQHIDALNGGLGIMVNQDDQGRGILKRRATYCSIFLFLWFTLELYL